MGVGTKGCRAKFFELLWPFPAKLTNLHLHVYLLGEETKMTQQDMLPGPPTLLRSAPHRLLPACLPAKLGPMV